MKKLLLALLLGTQFVSAQQVAPSRQNTVGQLQNNVGQVQSKTFAQPPKQGPSAPKMEGSKVKPNPFMQTADFAFIQNPTYEGGFRNGFSYGFSKSNKFGTSSIGANGLFTTDFTQRAISIFKSSHNKWIYSYSFAQVGTNQTSGFSITKIWNKENSTVGAQVSYSNVNGSSFKIGAPAFVFFTNKAYNFNKLTITPELYNTISYWYYDKDKKEWASDFTYNALVGSTFSYNLSKRFILNLTYRGNINTNPKFGLMNNILIGSNFKF